MAEGCDAAPRLSSAAFGAFCDANSSCTLVSAQLLALGLWQGFLNQLHSHWHPVRLTAVYANRNSILSYMWL